MTVELRAATAEDAPAIHRLIRANLEAGHLLPRSIGDIEAHAQRFTVATHGAEIVGCAELAPLSGAVAEVRSLVVDEACRGQRIGASLVTRLATSASGRGFSTLTAFTHDPSHFVRLGFSIVPHTWVPEKIARDCTSCPLFRQCGQQAVTLVLRKGATVRPERPAAVIYGRGVAPRRPNIERLHLPVVSDSPVPACEPEAVPA